MAFIDQHSELLNMGKPCRIRSLGLTPPRIPFDWDDANIGHIAAHEVTPEEAEQVLLSDSLELDCDLDINGEERWSYLGETSRGRILTIVFTMRGDKMRVAPPSTRKSWIRCFTWKRKQAGMTDLKVPKFKTEAEEAKWWYDNRSKLSAEFHKAAKEGRLKRGGVARLLTERGVQLPQPQAFPTTTIRLDPDDIAKAREQASRRGLRYQTYLKMIIHEALLKAEAAG